MLRPLGAFEQVFHLYMRRNPCHACLTAHLDGVLEEAELRVALERLRRVHPLLAATVEDAAAGDGPPLFRAVDTPVPLRVVPAGTSWQQVAAEEQTRTFDLSTGPLWRVVLLRDSDRACTLVLTVDHRIGDGVADLRVLHDLLALLNGRELPPQPVPAPQEALLEALREVPAAVGQGPQADEVADPRLSAMGALRPFDGVPPEVTSTALDAAATADLVRAARAEHTSVHAALCAAATSVLHAAGRDYVRIVSPKDLRRTVGLQDGVAIRIMPSRTGAAVDQVPEFWDAARAVAAALAPTRTPAGVLAASDALVANLPHGPDEAEAGMLSFTSLDMMLTNLGVVEVPDTGRWRLTGLEAFAMSVQIVGEQILSALTFDGRLTMTNTAHDPVPHLLEDVRAVLEDAVRASDAFRAASPDDAEPDTAP